MLQLKNITKRYEAGEFSVDALKGITLNFRTSDFVSILGPSGCGKTTLLNIVGGLDQYTDGDLIINGKSTKNFNDRDWDAYRNHSVGFVFQSYNLIPHQTVLQNVELALALSGVKKAERIARAKEALDKVGLHNMYHKRPSEMSGGQMQRVAIARAIVNNPDIVLADEPTGALDTETSVQVMDILKEISKDRLVVMVTHNPDLAEKYSTRIVRMLDGLLVDDTAPLTEEELQKEQQADQQAVAKAIAQKADKKHREKKPKMSFWTSFSLSLKNLFTKRGRTMLTGFAGSIGIIGIALIFAVSQGTTNYIASVQEDTLASYPLTIQQTNFDMTSMFTTFANAASFAGPSEEGERDANTVYEKMALANMTKAISSIESSQNDLKSFKTHIEAELQNKDSKLSQSLNGVHYTYNLNLAIYTQNEEGEIIESSLSTLMQGMVQTIRDSGVQNLNSSIISMVLTTSSYMSSMWEELLPATDGGQINDLVKSQYNLVQGVWPSSYDEVVLVVDENNQIDDMTAYALGLESRERIEKIVLSAITGEKYDAESREWQFSEIIGRTYKTILNYEFYRKNGAAWFDVRDVDNGLKSLYEDDNVGLNLKVVGIIGPNTDSASHMLSGGICYTSALTKYIIDRCNNSEIVKAQKADPDVDVFTGLYFADNSLSTAERAERFRNYVAGLSVDQQAEAYLAVVSIPTDEEVAQAAQIFYAMSEEDLRAMMLQILGGNPLYASYVNSASYEELQSFIPKIAAGVAQQQKVMTIRTLFADDNQLMAMQFQNDIANYTDQQCAENFELVTMFSDNTYEGNLVSLGGLDLNSPTAISLYAVSFAAKDDIADEIQRYNDGVEEESQKIEYTDFVGLIMSSVTTIIDAITYVLIGFVSISLVVSSIMIGVITLISVQERTKEIGILRAIGASKRNVSSMFNAETMIIGFLSGLLGVLVTYILSIFVNLILHVATGISTLNAVLPIWMAIVLVGISMLLTLVAGIIPSRSAAKKDPVVALRTE